jgi:hypothetical protein
MKTPNINNEEVKMAFEVEDIQERKNYTFVYNAEERTVRMFDTSRGAGNTLVMVYQETSMNNHVALFPTYYRDGHYSNLERSPFNEDTAIGYFRALYKKAVHEFNPSGMFIGWVHPETFNPLED